MATKNLVLGGSGAIGSHLCKHLLSIGEEVINVDIKEGWDIRTKPLDEYSHVDYVWFLAWDVGGAKFLTSQKNFLDIMNNNVRICQMVFNFLQQYQIPFLFASTQLAEKDNVYGLTKLLGEQWAQLLGGKVAKFWNVYAWEVPGERSHVIPDFIMKALINKRISLMTDGSELRQFIYATDCIQNLVKIRDTDLQEIHVTNGHWLPIKEVAEIVAQKLGAEVIPGAKQGYQNIMNPNETSSMFEYPTTLEEGIDEIIVTARQYLEAHPEVRTMFEE